jgi:hypothetical protein
MEKKVTITIAVPMNTQQCREWLTPEDYFNHSVVEALDKIKSTGFYNRSGSIDTDEEQATFKVSVRRIKTIKK